MTITKKHLYFFLAGLIAGLLTGFFIGKGMLDQPVREKVVSDTIRVTDTVPHYYPKPVEVERVRTEYQFLPLAKLVRDTVVKTDIVTMHDSVLVEVHITSKHYGDTTYDAWVSGYNPSLDSIFIYNEKQYITTTITKAKQRSRWSIGVQGGYGYGFKAKALEPYVGLGIGFNF